MIITESQVKELKPYIDNIEDFIESDNVEDLLDILDDIIVDNILGNTDEPDEVGIRLQKIYDEIYSQNGITHSQVNERTPFGGDYSEIYYMDDNGNVVDESVATKCVIRECKEDGTLLNEIWGDANGAINAN